MQVNQAVALVFMSEHAVVTGKFLVVLTEIPEVGVIMDGTHKLG